MPLISSRSVRKSIAEVRRNNRSLVFAQIADVDAMSRELESIRLENQSITASRLQRRLSTAYLATFAIAATSLAMQHRTGGVPPIPQGHRREEHVPDPNFVVHCLLAQIVNYSLAVLRLVEDGLDNPARCVLRALYELCLKTIVLSADADTLREYASANAPALEVWHRLFASGKLEKKAAAVERRVGATEDTIAAFRAYFRSAVEMNSEAVHHSFASAVMRSHVTDTTSSEFLHLNILGHTSIASRNTLENLNIVLRYTHAMLSNVISDIHGFTPPADNAAWQTVKFYTTCLETLRHYEKSRVPSRASERQGPPPMHDRIGDSHPI